MRTDVSVCEMDRRVCIYGSLVSESEGVKIRVHTTIKKKEEEKE